MHIAVITGPTPDAALQKIHRANTLADGVELRLDLFHHFSLPDVAKMRKACSGKLILTLRSKEGGGMSLFPEEKRIQTLCALADLSPDYIDLERESGLNALKLLHSKCKIISSYHNFEATPDDLYSIASEGFNPYAYGYKICTMANSTTDSERMLELAKQLRNQGIKCIALCMGEHGKLTREKGISSGNYLNYFILDPTDSCAPGLQLK